VDLLYHQRRVGLVLWHPAAQNVLLTAGECLFIYSLFSWIPGGSNMNYTFFVLYIENLSQVTIKWHTFQVRTQFIVCRENFRAVIMYSGL
jgi:hypothetical protein